MKNGNGMNITISLSSGIAKQGSNSLTRVLFGQSQGVFLAILGDIIDIGRTEIIGLNSRPDIYTLLLSQIEIVCQSLNALPNARGIIIEVLVEPLADSLDCITSPSFPFVSV